MNRIQEAVSRPLRREPQGTQHSAAFLFVIAGGSKMVPLVLTSHNDLNTVIGVALVVALVIYCLVTLVTFIRGL